MRDAHVLETPIKSRDQHQRQGPAERLSQRDLFLVLQKADRHGLAILQRATRRNEGYEPLVGHDEQCFEGDYRVEGYQLYE
jgi:hypothetical protein